MTLQRLLRLLPLGLLIVVSAGMAMMLVQDRASRATFEQVREAQSQRDALGRIRSTCEALTFKAVAWTLTRRSSQGRQYQEGKTACFDAVTQARASMGAAGGALASLGDELGMLAALLGAILCVHSGESKMVTVGRLGREVQP